MRNVSAVVLILAVVLAGTTVAGAHAFLERADPRVGSTVRTSLAEVRLWLSENLESAFSSVQVINAAGQRVDKGDHHVDPATPSLLRISLQPLELGTYKVIWRVLPVDAHVTEGDFTFRVTR